MPEEKNVQSIDRALDIIEAVAVEQEGLTLTEIADCVSLHKSTVYRLLSTLMKRGYIDKTHDNHYKIGLKPIEVVSGLRCPEWNKRQKGVANSQHMYGEAADLYFYGVSPNAALAWLKGQPEVRYAYRIEGSNNIHFDIPPVGR